MQVTFQGKAIEIKGQPVQVGDKAPEAKLLDNQGEVVEISSLFDKLTLLSLVPDVTTQTCHLQTKKFAELSQEQDWNFYTVSRNTVDQFNQWNEENSLSVQTLSDFDKDFGSQYGLAIDLGGKELLTRAVILVDKEGIIRYLEIVDEVTQQPDYDQAVAAIKVIQSK